MTDAQKPVPPNQPPRPPQAPPLKVATGAPGPKPPISQLPNPTLPRPTMPNQGVTLPTPGTSGDLNKAQLGTPPPPKMNATPQMPPAPKIPSPGQMPNGNRPPAPGMAPGTSSVINSTPVAKAPLPTAKQPPGMPGAKPVKPAEIRKSPFRFLPFLLGGLVILGIIAFIVMRFLGNGTTPGATTKEPVTLTYWGLWEPSPVLAEVIADYESTHQNVKIVYQQQSYRDYSDRLRTQISQNRGPDIFRFHASWVPMIKQELSPMPTTVYTNEEYKNIFYPVAAKQLSYNGSYVGVPLQYEGLALYYNTEILNTANVQPPATWAEMQQIAKQLTITDSSGNIQRGGLAIGNASNVNHYSDILGLLLLQNGVNPANVTTKSASDAVSFYTSFITKDKVWSENLPDSTTAFARGDVAMIFAPSWRAHDIQSLNPNLKFAVAPVPQLTDTKVTWASYWAEGVNAQSPHKAEAWEFLKYMSSPDTLRKFYSDASKVRTFGEIYSRKDMAGDLAADPYVGAYINDAPYASNWYLNSATHDNGINDNIIKYYEDAINKSLKNSGSMTTTMTTVQQGQAQILNQYGITINSGVAPTTTP